MIMDQKWIIGNNNEQVRLEDLSENWMELLDIMGWQICEPVQCGDEWVYNITKKNINRIESDIFQAYADSRDKVHILEARILTFYQKLKEMNSDELYYTEERYKEYFEIIEDGKGRVNNEYK